MTSPQSRPAGIITNPQNQVVLQSPQVQCQQQIVANKLTSAANSLLQLQQQQQLILASASPVVNLCNTLQTQNFVNSPTNGFKLCNGDNNESVNNQTSAAGPFKVYSELSFVVERILVFQLKPIRRKPLMNIFLVAVFHSTLRFVFNRQPRHFNLR